MLKSTELIGLLSGQLTEKTIVSICLLRNYKKLCVQVQFGSRMMSVCFSSEYIYKKTRWSLTGFHQRLCLCLLWPWPFDLLSMSQVQVHTWPSFGENIYKDIVFARFIGSLPAVNLTFYLWSQNLISTSKNPSTSVTKTEWNSLHWVLRYGVHKVFGTQCASREMTFCTESSKDKRLTQQQLAASLWVTSAQCGSFSIMLKLVLRTAVMKSFCWWLQ